MFRFDLRYVKNFFNPNDNIMGPKSLEIFDLNGKNIVVVKIIVQNTIKKNRNYFKKLSWINIMGIENMKLFLLKGSVRSEIGFEALVKS